MRAYAEKAYGIASEQVIGTAFYGKYTFNNDVALVKGEARVMLIDASTSRPGWAGRPST
jgi:hypothetical protein